MTQGTLSQTGNDLDLAIRGEGFFKIQMPDGTYPYTRDGSFQMDDAGPHRQRAGQSGAADDHDTAEFLGPDHQRPGPGLGDVAGTRQHVRRIIGQIGLTRFINKAGLQPIGDNLFTDTPASGPPQDGLANRRRLRQPCSKAASNRPMSTWSRKCPT